MNRYSESELILNPDGSIFHLRLFPEQISDHVILVGDPGRVEVVGQYLSNVVRLASNREFVSISGRFNGKPVTVISTGIGTDNTDIVINELDALVNIDLQSRCDLSVSRKLNLIRLGTSGSMQADIPAGSVVASAWSMGLDGLMKYYAESKNAERDDFEKSFRAAVNWPEGWPQPYAIQASAKLLRLVDSISIPGITVSAHGFYGPQGRQLRARLAYPELNSHLQKFTFSGLRTTNFEMESSALYGLSRQLGHEALTVCLIIANRMSGSFLGNYSLEMNNLAVNILNSVIR